MGVYVNPGNTGFTRIPGLNYVDKTGLMSLMNERIGGGNSLACISRPRRLQLDLKTTRKNINAVENGGVEKVCLAVDEMVNEGREEGREEGEGRKLATLVCRKLRKGKSVEIIADELEEDIAEIQLICEVAEEAAPEYDEEQVFYKVMERKGKALV